MLPENHQSYKITHPIIFPSKQIRTLPGWCPTPPKMDMKPEHPTYPNATSLLNAWQRTIAFILGPEEYQTYKDCLLENIYPENKKTIMPSLPMVHYVLRESHTA